MDRVVCFDVDETLVRIGPNQELIPHKAHIKALKDHCTRGHCVIVWSAGGFEWASHVIKELQLNRYVDLIIAKPSWCYDDRPESIIGEIVYLREEGFNNGRSTGSYQENSGNTEVPISVPTVTFGGSSVVYPLLKLESEGLDSIPSPVESRSGAV